MAYEMTDEERQEYDVVIEETVEEAKENPSRLMQLATDATRFLSVASNTVEQVKESGFFQRLRDLLPSSKSKAQMNELQTSVNSLTVSQEEIREMQKLSWRMLEQLNERNLLTADALITVKNNLNSLAIEQNEVKAAIATMAERVADRFEKLENRVANVEEAQRLNTWINGIEVEEYYESLPKTIRFLKIVKDFYEHKKANYSRDELKLLKKAIKYAGLDFKEPVSLGDITDSLIEELQNFDESEYLKITKIILPDNATITNKELSDMLAVPSFVTICMLPESKRRLEVATEVLKDNLQCDEVTALKKVVKKDIEKHNGIDMTVKMSLADLGIELISCYSAIPNLLEAYKKEEPEKLKKNKDECEVRAGNSLAGNEPDTPSQASRLLQQGIDEENEEKSFAYLKQAFEIDEKENVLTSAEKSSLYTILGGYYEFLEENPYNAFKFYKKGADLGDSECQFFLGLCYFDGTGTDTDSEKAFEMFRLAAESGYSGAYLSLGNCYRYGMGCQKNEYKAYECYENSANADIVGGICSFAECYLYGIGVEVDDHKAFSLLKRAYSISSDFEKAQKLLADCYRYGWGTKQNMNEAIQHYKEAAKQNNADAQLSLGMIYFTGESGVTENNQTGYQWFKRSAENGNAIAMHHMGFCCENGLGCKKSPEKAFEWYKQSAEAGDADGRFEVGLCFLNGYGCDADEDYGIQLIQEAAENGSEDAQKWIDEVTSNSDSQDNSSSGTAIKAGGAAAGAAIGTAILPGVGTVIGGALGWLAGKKFNGD